MHTYDVDQDSTGSVDAPDVPDDFLPAYEKVHSRKESTDPIVQPVTKPKPKKNSGGTKSLAQIATLPLFNVIITCILIGLLLCVYILANGKTVDYKIANINIPSLVSLLVTLLKMCIAGGLGYALSEYKWVKLQYIGGPLALLEVFDACTRGIGGIARVVSAVRFDLVLVPSLLIQIGLIVIGPASQQILTSVRPVHCDFDSSSLMRYLSPDSQQLYPPVNDPRSITGPTLDYVTNYAWYTSSVHGTLSNNAVCPSKAINCTFSNVTVLHTAAECNPGTLNSTGVVNYSDSAYDKQISLYNLYEVGNTSAASNTITTPQIFYDQSMYGRTYADLVNLTLPSTVFDTYDPTARRYFGDQTFVLVTNQTQLYKTYSVPVNQLDIQQCTLRSYLNATDIFIDSGGRLTKNVTSSTPITLDYDRLSNASDVKYGDNVIKMMMNAYSLQLSIMKHFILNPVPEDFVDIANLWSFDPDGIPAEPYLTKVLHDISFATTTVPLGLPGSMNWINSAQGYTCTENDLMTYQVNPASYYSVSLSLLLPLIWWIVIWVISLHQTNGVSRGNSQLALMVTGLTPSVQEHFNGYSHSGQNELFNRSKDIHVHFGETRDGRVAFGNEDELDPIRPKRMSYAPENFGNH